MWPLCSFTDNESIRKITARALIEVEAVHFMRDKPFILTSGKPSPVYIDCRKLISYPRLRSVLTDFALSKILSEIGLEKIDSVAGGETAGIAYAAWIAQALGLPMQYIRKQAKGFGRNAQIEGCLPEHSQVLLVEDLATDGASKVKFCEAIRQVPARVEHVFVVFYYDIFPQSHQILNELGITLHYLTAWWDVLEIAKNSTYFSTQTIQEVESFLHEPEQWVNKHL